jgi:NADP-dependent 3-hydroxy acid dehydrogenase YdfG
MTLGRAGIPVVATATRERAEIGPIATEAGKNMALPVLADVTREVDAEYVVKAALV